jgi:hypothetical protein
MAERRSNAREVKRLLVDAVVLTMKLPRQEIEAEEYFDRMDLLIAEYRKVSATQGTVAWQKTKTLRR